MRKVFIFLVLTGLVVFQFNCTYNAALDDANRTKSNVSQPPIVESNQTNVDLANVKVAETPLSVFMDADTALTEGKKLLDANATEKAVEAFRQAVKLDPELADAYFNMGIALALLEKEQEAVPSTEEEPTPTAKKGKKEVVKLTASEKAFDDASKLYEKITKKNPKDDAAFFNLGRSFNKLNKDKEAEKALRQAVKLKADDGEYQTELGAILIKLAQYDQAVIALKKAISLDEANSHTQDLLAKAEAGQKRINFGIKPKLAQQQMQSQPSEISRPRIDKPRTRATPALKIETPLPKSN